MAKPTNVGNGNKNTAPALDDTTITVNEGALFSARVLATDPDKKDVVTYSFGNGGLIYVAEDGLVFKIDPASGLITSSTPLDYEKQSTYSLVVKATDSFGASDTGVLTITVKDVNEFNVAFVGSGDADASVNAVAEGAAAGTLVGVTASASDADGTNHAVSYQLVDAQGAAVTNGAFAINATSGVVVVRDGSLIDYETAATQTIYVKAMSSDGSSTIKAFTIAVSDVNEFNVAFVGSGDADASVNVVAEGAAAGTLVGVTASASDADGANHAVSYQLVDAQGAAVTNGAFAINATSGVVVVRDGSLIDYETAATQNIYVKAMSSDGSSTIKAFTIAVADVNEFNVAFVGSGDADASVNAVAEGAAAGTLVGVTASASDADGANHAVSYQLVDAQGAAVTNGAFAINATSGVVAVRDGSLIDYETAATQTIYVKAMSSDGSSTIKAFTIAVSDVNEFNVPFVGSGDADVSVNAVAEGAAAGTLVGVTASASDADGANHAVSYQLVDAQGAAVTNGAFAINATSGVVSVRDGSLIDYETAATQTIYLKAMSSDGSSTTKSFTIDVQNVNEAHSGEVTISAERITTDVTFARALTAADVVDPKSQFFDSANGHIYQVVNEAVTWTEAANASARMSISGVAGYLVTVTSSAENAFVAGLIGGHVSVGWNGDTVWLGGSDAAHEGTWTWMSGPEAGQTFWPVSSGTDQFWNWYAGNPFNENSASGASGSWSNPTGSGSDYLMMYGPSYNVLGQWDDVYSSTTAVSSPTSPVASSDGVRNAYVVEYSGDVVDHHSVDAYRLTADASTLSDPEGVSSVTFAWQQLVDGEWRTLAGQNAQSADFDAVFSGATVRSALSYVDGLGAHETVYSAAVLIPNVATIYGDAGKNVLTGTALGDVIRGEAGDDNLIGGAGDDLLDGGPGHDWAVYSDALGPIDVQMAAGIVTGSGVGQDTLRSIERVEGSAFADHYDSTGFSGSSLNAGSDEYLNVFEGMGGDDVVIGNGVNTRMSYVKASAGVTLDMNAGIAYGTDPSDAAGIGTDHFTGVSQVRSSNFADTLYGTDSKSVTEVFEARGGADYIDGRGGFDRAGYKDESAGIDVHLADGTVYGGDAGQGQFDTLRNIEGIQGSEFDDIFDARGFSAASINSGVYSTNNLGQAFNQFEGMGGNDLVYGNGNTTLLYGNADAGVTIDMLAGTASSIGANDAAHIGHDTFTGVSRVIGSDFDDIISGTGASDAFEGRGGNDVYYGLGGYDYALYSNENFATGIRVQLANGVVTAENGTDTLRSVEAVRGTNYADTFDATGFSSVSLNAGSNGVSNDFEGRGGDDLITGNGSTRVLYQLATAGVTVDIAAGVATGDASVGTDTFTNVSGARGSAYADVLLGNALGNFIEGGAGDDVINGRGGYDFLNGGAGSDTFVFDQKGGTTIQDFAAGDGVGHDVIDFATSVFADMGQVLAASSQVGSNVQIHTDAGDILLSQVTLSNLTAADFHFHI